jgi:hypothetical protein
VDRLLSQKIDQSLAEFRREMEEFRQAMASGTAESTDEATSTSEEQAPWE